MDEKGNKNKINKIEDIYRLSKKKEKSENYFSRIYLEINNNSSKEEYERKLEDTVTEKERKIKKLQDLIENTKKSNSEEINKIIIENFCSINKNKLFKNPEIENVEKEKIIKKELSGISNFLIDLVEKEKINIFSEIIENKKDIISQMKKEFKGNNKTSFRYKDIKENLIKINSKIKDNIKSLDNFRSNLGNIKQKINNFEEEKNKGIYEENIMNNNLSFMKSNKIYKCTNCNFSFCFNECFNKINNKNYNEHSFELQNYENKLY